MAEHKCLNGHPANADGLCSVEQCDYYVGKRHDGIGRFNLVFACFFAFWASISFGFFMVSMLYGFWRSGILWGLGMGFSAYMLIGIMREMNRRDRSL